MHNINKKLAPLIEFFNEFKKDKTGVVGLCILVLAILISLFEPLILTYKEAPKRWRDITYWQDNPASAPPEWLNFFQKEKSAITTDIKPISIETNYADDKLTGTSFLKDTTIQSDGNKSVSLTSWDYTYDSKGQMLSMKGYNVDPKTGERASRHSAYEYTYDSQGRTLSEVSTYYEDNIIDSSQKSEYERQDEGRSYIMNNYKQDLETDEWTLISRYRYEYEETGEDSYYERNSDWDMESEEWVVTSGSKYEYETDGNSYTQINYNWDTNSNDWMITYGYKYVDETDGESYTRIDAEYDVTNNNWNIFYSDKAEATEGNPMIIKRYYLPENDLENWQMYGIDYYYYSESSVANEAIQTVDARIYTRPGTIHVDMEGKAALSVYAANGACCYQSSITSSTVVSNLQRGIYFVVLQGDSGTKKVKVLVK